jgi:hypothetical protein
LERGIRCVVGVTPSNRLFIVMPYFAADSLAQRLRQTGPIPWPEALQMLP